MPHRGLRCPQRDARLREVRAKRVPQGMNLDRAAALVGLDDIQLNDKARRCPDVVNKPTLSATSLSADMIDATHHNYPNRPVCNFLEDR